MPTLARQLANECAAIVGAGIQSNADTCSYLGKTRDKSAALRMVCDMNGIDYPESRFGLRSEAARLMAADWWKGKLKAEQARSRELKHIQAMHTQVQALKTAEGRKNTKRRVGYKYVSDNALSQHRENKARLREYIEAAIAICEDGDVFPLKRLAAASISNPVCRRAELMTRIRGFEDWAKLQGHFCLFFTVTCPSRFHANSARFDASTPKEAQEYLVKVWAKVRAMLAANGVKYYGFRVTEPHRDGCPHWHMLLWFNTAEGAKEGQALIEKYFLQDSPNEAGAQKNRVKTKTIDMKEGSAAGYVAKYISKNIDGFYADGKTTFDAKKSGGLDSRQAAERVLAYAALWRIRQFQQVGGPRVGVWRELRSVRTPEGIQELQKAGAGELHKAADESDWAAFVAAAQGKHLKMLAETSKSMLLKLELEYGEFDAIPADKLADLLNQWGEPTIRRHKGLVIDGLPVVTRTRKWIITRKHKDDFTPHVPEFGTRLEIIMSKTFDELTEERRQTNRAISEAIHSAKMEAAREAGRASAFSGQSPPWSTGNNCKYPPRAAEGEGDQTCNWQ